MSIPEADGERDPALYKCKVLMKDSQPLTDPADLPLPRFPKEFSEAEQRREWLLFTPRGNAKDTYGRDYKQIHNDANHVRSARRSRTGLFTRYQKPGDKPTDKAEQRTEK